MSEPIARTVKDFCRAYGISKSETYRLLAAGRLCAVKAGATTLITEESAKTWFLGLPAASTSGRKAASTSPSTSDTGIGRVTPGRMGKAKRETSHAYKEL